MEILFAPDGKQVIKAQTKKNEGMPFDQSAGTMLAKLLDDWQDLKFESTLLGGKTEAMRTDCRRWARRVPLFVLAKGAAVAYLHKR